MDKETNNEVKKYKEDIRDLPLWLKYAVAIFAILGTAGTLFGVWGTYVLKSSDRIQSTASSAILENATSSINISDIFTKARKLDSALERQDFLKKYIGSKIYGKGSVEEVSRWSDGYLIDIINTGYLISCSLGSGEENERRVSFLKGKTVNFSGTFTFNSIFDHGLSIKDCFF